MFASMVPVDHAAYAAGYAESLVVTDTWEPYIRWGVLSMALGKDGDGQDVKRSGYAKSRYLLGVKLALRLIVGNLEEPGMANIPSGGGTNG